MAFFFAMLMFSLAGIPPLAGFFAKWYVFNAAIQAHLYPLAVIGVLSSAVAAFYYLRIVKIMYFDEAARRFRPSGAGAARRACGEQPSRAVLVRLSGSFYRRHDGRGQIAVLTVVPRPSLEFSNGGLALSHLEASVRALGFRLAAYEALGSTNDEALARARAGDPGASGSPPPAKAAAGAATGASGHPSPAISSRVCC